MTTKKDHTDDAELESPKNAPAERPQQTTTTATAVNRDSKALQRAEAAEDDAPPRPIEDVRPQEPDPTNDPHPQTERERLVNEGLDQQKENYRKVKADSVANPTSVPENPKDRAAQEKQTGTAEGAKAQQQEDVGKQAHERRAGTFGETHDSQYSETHDDKYSDTHAAEKKK